MPKREDLETILIIGSGPIVIGQACEFDYSGTQACRVLRDEGYRVVLVNSNPATIMTDPEFADATYVEPLDVQSLTRIIERERPDALLPTLGGQTALNLSIELADAGVLDEYGVELIGASVEAIHTAENREQFKAAMQEIGLSVPKSGLAYTLEEAMQIGEEVGFPLIIRPSFILGGSGTGFADDADELRQVAAHGLATSPVSEILIEQSIAGWKEYELEVMRDHADNVVVICSIENFDAMGVHTGDSITVAPAQTLTDVEYQRLRDEAFACIRRIGVDTGGSNIQFAVNPENGDVVVIEMNPRVSRSSALASKATGFPIAKIAARLAVGYRLDEIMNDITGETPASFEPTIDYVVTKVPRWAFEKLPGASPVLGTMMQSVGEVMAIGRTFPESLQKALRSLETGRWGLNCDPTEREYDAHTPEQLVQMVVKATPERPFLLDAALRRGVSVARLYEATGIDPWFLEHLASLGQMRAWLSGLAPTTLTRREWRKVKRAGFSDAQLGYVWGVDEQVVYDARISHDVRVTYKTVDTCAAEFAAQTPYHYGTYEDEDEVAPLTRPAVVILGSGPNRIGQGVEFDYCCVHAAFALSDAGFETVMLNCNPETVSTDYDTSDRLFFEPLFPEDVLAVCRRLQERADLGGGELAGVVVALGGQTPLKLARTLEDAGVRVLGTSPDSIDLAEDRERFHELCTRLGIAQPPGATVATTEEAQAIASDLGFPVLVRPSYVLGGRAMQIVYDDESLVTAMAELAAEGSLGREGGLSADRPVLVDRFLEDAVEVDVDAIRDATGDSIVGGVMEHIEEAGVHSGDSACAIPPQTLSAAMVARIEAQTKALADALDVRGLLNVQYAVKGDELYVIEANPRASRTVPFVSKATGVPLAKVASRVMVGATLAELREEGLLRPPAAGGHVAVKEAVLPFKRFPDVDTVLGPEMRSTGEVMGIDRTFGMAFAKSQTAAGNRIPREGTVFFSLADRDKAAGVVAARRFTELGYTILATAGTAAALEAEGLHVEAVVGKLTAESEDAGLDAVDLLQSGKVDLVVNTPRGRGPRADGAHIRRTATARGIPCVTTVAAALAASAGILEWASTEATVRSLQEYHRERATSLGSVMVTPAVDLSVTLGRLCLESPVVTASGTFGHGDEVARLGEPSRLGAITAKSVSPEPWAGKPAPRLHMTASGMVNAVGLQGPGMEAWLAHDLPALRASGARVIASVWGHTVDDFARATELLDDADVVAVEVNASCPNLHAMDQANAIWAHDPEATRTVVRAVRDATSLPVFAKLSPNVTDLTEIARAAVEGGADGLTLVNTVLALVIDAETRRPVLGGGGGGLSGPAIKPVALRAVRTVTRALPDVPVIGTGGVQSGVDAVEMLLAGASAVAVGTANFRDPRAPYRVLDELIDWCARHDVARVRDLTGALED